jgi:hypothetical protein
MTEGQPAEPGGHDEPGQRAAAVPLPLVVARILIVSGMGFAAALSIFFLVGGLWLPGAVAAGATAVFLGLMFLIERAAEPRRSDGPVVTPPWQ